MAQNYPSPGRCIYCQNDNGKLTDEHIIPLALQGVLVAFWLNHWKWLVGTLIAVVALIVARTR